MITEVRINLADFGDDSSDGKLLAYCSITINNAYVIRDLKLIESPKGRFVAMPSRKIEDKCNNCGGKNHLRAKYCNECGARLNPSRAELDTRGRPRLHADVVHPINAETRIMVTEVILKEYEKLINLGRDTKSTDSTDPTSTNTPS